MHPLKQVMIFLGVFLLLSLLLMDVTQKRSNGGNSCDHLLAPSTNLAQLRERTKAYETKHPFIYYYMPSDDPFGKKFMCSNLKSLSPIIGGTEAIPFSRPWMVYLLLHGFACHYCAGFLISNQWILTAAHCIDPKTVIISTTAIIGLHSYKNRKEENTLQIEFTRKDAYVHPDFDYDLQKNDIGLIRLPQKLKNHPHIQPICLPKIRSKPEMGDICEAAGWGIADPILWQRADKLQRLDVEIKNCNDSTICTGHPDNATKQEDSCSGDSGGPLVCQIDGILTAVGVLSTGPEACDASLIYTKYTRVYDYLDWIKDTLEKHG